MGDLVGKDGARAKLNPAEAAPDPAALSLMTGTSVSKGLDGPFPLQPLIPISLQLLSCVRTALYGGGFTAEVSQHPVVSKCSPGFIFTTSCSVLSKSSRGALTVPNTDRLHHGPEQSSGRLCVKLLSERGTCPHMPMCILCAILSRECL